MPGLEINLKNNKKIYFASDIHLGLSAMSPADEVAREKKVVRWLASIGQDAQAVFLVGDIFDFWFEYNHVVPKGFVRFFGQLASMADHGISIYFFTGNHDLWMFRYLQSELGATVFHKPVELVVNGTTFYVAHGDGLGPGDYGYKFLKVIFTSSIAQWLFKWLHPDIGVGMARLWSKSSRLAKSDKELKFFGDKEFLIRYARQKEAEKHRDFYIFGHRHIVTEYPLNERSVYINLGEWVNHFTYGVFDGTSFELKKFDEKS